MIEEGVERGVSKSDKSDSRSSLEGVEGADELIDELVES